VIEISKGVFVVDVQKFLDIYEARCSSVSVLSDGVKIRYKQYLKAINDSK